MKTVFILVEHSVSGLNQEETTYTVYNTKKAAEKAGKDGDNDFYFIFNTILEDD